MKIVGKIVGSLLFSDPLWFFQNLKVSNVAASRQHRTAQTVSMTGSSPVRSAT